MALSLLRGSINVATRAQMTEFKLQHTTAGEVRIVSLCGYMGNAEFCQVDGELATLLKQGHHRVIVDLAQLSFTTSISLARLQVCAREFNRHGGELKFAGLSPFLSRLAGLAGFGKKKHLEADVEGALQAMALRPKVKARRPRSRN
jgi:anti-anti-sigma factor